MDEGLPEGPPDRALLDQIIAEDGITTDPGARFDELILALLQELREWLADGTGVDFGNTAQIATYVGLGLLGLVTLWALFLLARRLRPRRRATKVRPLAPVALTDPADPTSTLEAALAAGDARAALAALWAELALGLGEAGFAATASRDRTHQELVRLVRQSRPSWDRLADLTRLARVLDRLCYGPVEPSVDDVRALVPQTRGLLA